jgi:hypothetical protein
MNCQNQLKMPYRDLKESRDEYVSSSKSKVPHFLFNIITHRVTLWLADSVV